MHALRRSSNKLFSAILALFIAFAGVGLTGGAPASATPTNVQVSAVSPNIVKVTWSAPSSGTVTKYSVQYKLASDSAWTIADDNVANNIFRRNINGLVAASAYNVRVVATFSDNSVASSSTVSHSTGAACSFPGAHSAFVGSGSAQELFLGGNYIEIGARA